MAPLVSLCAPAGTTDAGHKPPGLPTAAQLKRRFMHVQGERARRLHAVLGPRRRQVLDLLPLLFHVNHAALPGFESPAMPAGIADFSPAAATLQTARRLLRGYAPSHYAARLPDIEALYLMGSSGGIAHGNGSDLDLWVCIRAGLAPEALAMLARKAAAIERWAARLKVELHCFVLNAQEFRAGGYAPLSSESMGATQQRLLLEEFYRTGLLLAGRYPLWWLVPEGEDHDAHLAALLRCGQIRPDEGIDFGPVSPVPAREFLGAGLWHLNKAIDAPYKSLLKILLMAAYSADALAPRLLSETYKALVHAGEEDADRLDPYLLMLERIEADLLRQNDSARIDLARRCLYYKIGEPLGRPGADSPRRRLLARTVARWGWDATRLQLLDQRPYWKIDQARAEREELTAALRLGYQRLSQAARREPALEAALVSDLALLTRRLAVHFERRPGEVALWDSGNAARMQESQLHLDRRDERTWLLHRGARFGARPGPLLKTADSLLELSAWLYFNGLFSPGTGLTTLAARTGVSAAQWRELIQALAQTFPERRLPAPELAALRRPARPVRVLVFINLGADRLTGLHRQGLRLTSVHSDPLNYGSRRLCLAARIDVLLLNSWGELLASAYSGAEGLLDALCELCAYAPAGGASTPPALELRSATDGYGPALCQRIEALYAALIETFHRPGARPGRFVLELAGGQYLLEAEYGSPRWRALSGRPALYAALAQVSPGGSELHCDAHALTDTPLPELVRVHAPGEIHVCFLVHGGSALIHVLDTEGALFVGRTEFFNSDALLGHYQRFVRHALAQRPGGETVAVHYHQAIGRPGGPYRLERRTPPPASGRELELIAIARTDAAGNERFDWLCADQYLAAEHDGATLPATVVSRVLAQRRPGALYPVYLSGLRLPPAAVSSSLVPDLMQKSRLETLLEAELAWRRLEYAGPIAGPIAGTATAGPA